MATSSLGNSSVAQMTPLAVEEYREIGLNLRHYSNMQYVNLTLALAAQAALLTTLLRNPPLPTATRVILSAGGALITILFYVNEHRIRLYWTCYFRRARELDDLLNFAQYVKAPGRSVVSSGMAIRALFIVLFIFWIVSVSVPRILS
jgi:hypothetical protein